MSLQNKNSILNRKEWKNGELLLKSLPRMIFIEFTRCCNLYCGMCRSKQILSNELFMPQNILDKIETEVVPYVECIDVRGWGESTLDSRLLPFIEKYADSKTINLYTNLNARDEAYWEKLSKLPINIVLSIESADPDRYALFRRGGNYEKIEKHLTVIKKSGVAKLYIAATILEDNMIDMRSLVDLARKYNAQFLQFSPISRQKIGTEYPNIGFETTDSVLEQFKQISIYAHKKNVNVCISANLDTINTNDNFRCIHPWSYCYFRYDGKIGFCDHLLCKNSSLVGDLSKNSFMEIWNSEQMIQSRKYHRTKDFTVLKENGIECDWCYKNRYANFEFLIQKDIKPIPLEDYITLLESRK